MRVTKSSGVYMAEVEADLAAVDLDAGDTARENVCDGGLIGVSLAVESVVVACLLVLCLAMAVGESSVLGRSVARVLGEK